MTKTRRAVRAAAGVLFAGGILALGYVAFVVIGARVYQMSEQRRLGRATAEASAAPAALEGAAIGQIHIARLGLTAVIVQGDSADILQRAVGHLVETALPGEAGNVVLAAHRDTFFRPLKGIRTGDVIVLATPARAFEYVVVSTAVVPPDAVAVLRPTAERTLTLVTCFPFSYLGAAPNRFIVRAREVVGAQPEGVRFRTAVHPRVPLSFEAMSTAASREPYAVLNAYLSGRFADTVVLTFAQIEDLLGFALPAAARVRTDWWMNDAQSGEPSPQSSAWTRANRTASPNLFARTVRFERDIVVVQYGNPHTPVRS